MDGDDWFWAVIKVLIAAAIFCAGGAVGSWTAPGLTEREVVEHGCAQYGPTTGEFEWKEEMR